MFRNAARGSRRDTKARQGRPAGGAHVEGVGPYDEGPRRPEGPGRPPTPCPGGPVPSCPTLALGCPTYAARRDRILPDARLARRAAPVGWHGGPCPPWSSAPPRGTVLAPVARSVARVYSGGHGRAAWLGSAVRSACGGALRCPSGVADRGGGAGPRGRGRCVGGSRRYCGLRSHRRRRRTLPQTCPFVPPGAGRCPCALARGRRAGVGGLTGVSGRGQAPPGVSELRRARLAAGYTSETVAAWSGMCTGRLREAELDRGRALALPMLAALRLAGIYGVRAVDLFPELLARPPAPALPPRSARPGRVGLVTTGRGRNVGAKPDASELARQGRRNGG